MQWLQTLLAVLVAVAGSLALVNGAALASYARRAGFRARRVGALALAAVCFAVALESLVWLVVAHGELAALTPALQLAARAALLLSMAFLSLLVLRARPR